MAVSAFLAGTLLGIHGLQVPIEKVHTSLVIANQFKLVKTIPGKRFFLYLFSHIPLEKIVGGIVLFLYA